MVIRCVVYNCGTQGKAGSGYSFHKFPQTNPERRPWITFCCRVSYKKTDHGRRKIDWKPTNHSVICNLHFVPTDYETNMLDYSHRRLKKSALPSQHPPKPAKNTDVDSSPRAKRQKIHNRRKLDLI